MHNHIALHYITLIIKFHNYIAWHYVRQTKVSNSLQILLHFQEQYSSEYSPTLFSGGSSQIPVTFAYPTEAIIHILPQLDPQESSSESVTHHDGSSIAAPLCVTLLFMLLFVGLFFFARLVWNFIGVFVKFLTNLFSYLSLICIVINR